jgi:hypothetical protein
MQQNNTIINNAFADTCASQRTNTMNDRAYSRLIPSQPLQPYLSVAPVQTKYTVLPIVNHRTPAKEQVAQRPVYNIQSTFNPGTSAPWSGFASEINTESSLRNQVYAIQKCSQAVYVPKSSSDLYNVQFSVNSRSQQPFPGLFTEYVVPGDANNATNTRSKGSSLFNNSTRTMDEPC